jgi:hypothetical protein
LPVGGQLASSWRAGGHLVHSEVIDKETQVSSPPLPSLPFPLPSYLPPPPFPEFQVTMCSPFFKLINMPNLITFIEIEQIIFLLCVLKNILFKVYIIFSKCD